MENELLRERIRLLESGQFPATHDILAWSRAYSCAVRRRYGVERVCRAWSVPRSSFYVAKGLDRAERPARGRKPALQDAELVAEIRRLHEETAPLGYRRVWRTLRDRGMRASRVRVLRLMHVAARDSTTAQASARPENDPWVRALLDERSHNLRQLILSASRLLNRAIVEKLRERGYDAFRVTHLAVTSNIDFEGTRLSVLAERANLTEQAMNYLVGELERLGMVIRKTDPTDGRARLVFFTETGRQFKLDNIDAFRQIETAFDDALGAERMNELRTTLASLANLSESALS